MPAQTVATPAAVNPAVAPARAAPVQAQESSPGGDQFGRELDAARTQQQKPAAPAAAKTPAAGASQDGKPSAAGTAPKPANGAPSGGATDSTASAGADTAAEATDALPGGTTNVAAAATDSVHDGAQHDQDAGEDEPTNANAAPQFALASLFPFVGAALPGAMAHRGAFASSAGMQLGANGAAAVTSGILDAAKMLLASAVNGRDGGGSTGGTVTNPTGLASLLDAVQSRAADDAQPAGTPAAGIGTTPLLPLATPAVGMHLLAVAAPLGSDGFNQDLARQVTWLASQDIKQARIRVHPEDLGPVDLKVSMSHDRVDVVFSVQHPGTMQALQQSLPQLGQMLAQHGLSLGHAEVGQHGGNHPSTHSHGGSRGASDESDNLQATTTSVVTSAPNLLDAFA